MRSFIFYNTGVLPELDTTEDMEIAEALLIVDALKKHTDQRTQYIAANECIGDVHESRFGGFVGI